MTGKKNSKKNVYILREKTREQSEKYLKVTAFYFLLFVSNPVTFISTFIMCLKQEVSNIQPKFGRRKKPIKF